MKHLLYARQALCKAFCLCHAVGSCEAGASIVPLLTSVGSGAFRGKGLLKVTGSYPFVFQRKLPTDESKCWHVTLFLLFKPAERNINLFERLNISGILETMPVHCL